MKLIKFTALAVLFLAVFVASIGFNVLIHESAHYAVADHYDLNPEMNFATTSMSTAALYSTDSDIAYITYLSSSAEVLVEDSVIAVAGPLANLAIACFALLLYFNPKRSVTGKMLLMLLMVVSFVSFGVNVLPFPPGDGYYIWYHLI
jgi:hypothetical protein